MDYLYGSRLGAKKFLEKLHEKYTVVVFTTRSNGSVRDWLDIHHMFYDDVTGVKPPEVAYIDDRTICFNGDFIECLNVLDGFKAHWE